MHPTLTRCGIFFLVQFADYCFFPIQDYLYFLLNASSHSLKLPCCQVGINPQLDIALNQVLISQISPPPNQQKMKNLEFKAQLSLKFPLIRRFLIEDTSLNFGYTQLFYWQFYAKSQYFRETNYEPELFWTSKLLDDLWVDAGVVHQSNGRGGSMERSWNRVFCDLKFSKGSWLISIRPWVLIFKNQSSNQDNPDIDDYLGHGRFLIVYKANHKNIFSLMLRNNMESGFRRGAIEFNYNFPIYEHISGYLQVFAGYGQSLIEYNHSTKGIGIGIALNNWI